jgi:dolichol-phosphate mannosyltransferase
VKACVVVPTYNERENIKPLLDRLRKVDFPGLQVLFVDDSSPDGTSDEIRKEITKDPSFHLLVRGTKKGIGSAHIDGFAEAIRELGADVLIEMDADLQQPPEKIPELVSAVSAGADVAVGSRKVSGGGAVDWSLWRRTVSRGANFYARTVLGIPVKDCTSGFRALNKAAAQFLVESDSQTSEFFFQVASLYKLKKRGMRMVEVPFIFGARAAGKSKLSRGEFFGFFIGVLKLRSSSTG